MRPGLEYTLFLASLSIAPHSGVPAIRPTPRKAKLETDIIAVAIPVVKYTINCGNTFGIKCRVTILKLEAPEICAASIYYLTHSVLA